MTWKDGALVNAKITSKIGGPLNIRSGSPLAVKSGDAGAANVSAKDGVISLATDAGEAYTFSRE
jgi:hypothetical protein